MHKKTWSQVLSLVPLSKAFALPELSKRATSSPTLCVYVDAFSYPRTTNDGDKRIQYWLYTIHPMGRSVALFPDNSVEVAKFY